MVNKITALHNSFLIIPPNNSFYSHLIFGTLDIIKKLRLLYEQYFHNIFGHLSFKTSFFFY